MLFLYLNILVGTTCPLISDLGGEGAAARVQEWSRGLYLGGEVAAARV